MVNASPIGGRIAEQPGERDREVVGMRDRPLARSVAVDDDGAPGAHPRDIGPAAEGRQQPLVVGVRRPHDGHRQTALAVCGDEHVLARDLVARVLPERVAQRRRLGHRHPPRRLLVRGRRADEHVLPGASLEQLEVGGDVLGREGQELGDDVEPALAEGGAHRAGVPDIGLDELDLRRERASRGAAVEHRDLVPEGHRAAHARRADRSGTADVEDARHLCEPTPGRRHAAAEGALSLTANI